MPTLELLSPSGEIQKAIQKAIDLASFGLQAAEHLEIDSLHIPGLRFQLAPAQNLAMDVEQVRAQFRAWVLANAIRDCVDAIGPSLEWARKICFFWTREGEIHKLEDGKLRLSAQISGEDWNKHIIDEANQFEYWPLRKKLNHLETVYGLPAIELAGSILSLNRARNCLTHRSGVVGIEDVKHSDAGVLEVTWIKLQIRAQGKEGQRILELPAHVEAGELVSIGFDWKCKTFRIGERIDFSSDEFVEISTTFLLFALQLQKAIVKLQQSRNSSSPT